MPFVSVPQPKTSLAIATGVAAMVVFAAREVGWVSAPLVGLGYVAWTLAYYIAHRFVFHHRSCPAWLKKFEDHGFHHRYPNDPTEIEFRWFESVPVIAVAFVAAWVATFQIGMALAFAAGFAVGFLNYEWLHFAVHNQKHWRHPWVRRWVQRHWHHHYTDQRKNFGTIVPWWDWLFGTAHKKTGMSKSRS